MKAKVVVGGFAAGVPGVIASIYLYLPTMLAGKPLPMPMPALQLMATLQSCVMLAVAVIVGALLAPKVGLRTPLSGGLKPALIPGMAGGVLGIAVLMLASLFTPPQLQADMAPIPALVRVLYGGITEELLLRWGFMTLVAWILWRLFERRAATPSAAVMALSIVISALLFGIGHLPAAAALAGHLTPGIVAYIIIGNAGFGVVAGWLYWKAGLEAAILAHVTTHIGLLLFAMK